MKGQLDAAKLRLVMIPIAAVCGLIGLVTLAVGMAALLDLWMPWPAAVLATAAVFLLIGGIAAWAGLRPDVGLDQEAREAVELATGVLTDLPTDMARKMIVERPLAAVGLAAGLGALLARRPDAVMQLVQQLATRAMRPEG